MSDPVPRSMHVAASKKTSPTDAMLKRLREGALARYPESHLKSPWPGHLDLAVRDKTFAYLSIEGEPLGVSCKLPHSNAIALMLPYAAPTGYGLGKSGWVSVKFPEGETPDEQMLAAWIEESYRAQAPKKLIAQLDGVVPKAASKKKAPTKAAPKKKAPAKKRLARGG